MSYKVGDCVVPFQKTVRGYQRDEHKLFGVKSYITYIYNQGDDPDFEFDEFPVYVVSGKKDDMDGDFFLERDFKKPGRILNA